MRNGECEGSGVVTFAVVDIVESIKGFKNNKTPGPDGLTIEFYRSFREDLVPEPQEVFKAVAVSATGCPWNKHH